MTRTPLVLSVLLLAIVPRPVAAQDHPSVDVFGGYSLLPADGDDFPRQTSHGFQAAVTGHLNRWFGIVGDIGAQFNTATDLGFNFQGRVAKTTVWQYLVGPRFTARTEGVDMFVHGLFGTSTGDAGPNFEGFSDSGLTFGGGGGVDVRMTRRFSVRAQFDLLGSFADIVEGNSRFAVGGVVRFGGS